MDSSSTQTQTLSQSESQKHDWELIFIAIIGLAILIYSGYEGRYSIIIYFLFTYFIVGLFTDNIHLKLGIPVILSYLAYFQAVM